MSKPKIQLLAVSGRVISKTPQVLERIYLRYANEVSEVYKVMSIRNSLSIEISNLMMKGGENLSSS